MLMNNCLSSLTKRALRASTGAYLTKDMDEHSYIEALKKDNDLSKIYRFDVGKNTDGISPQIAQILGSAELGGLAVENIVEYPDNHYKELRSTLAQMHGVKPEQFVFGAGLDSVIDQLCRSVFNFGDSFILPIPNFDVFEEHSKKSGGEPLYVQLKGPDYHWTGDTIEEICQLIHDHGPKVVWISNPVNPTGQNLPLDYILPIVQSGAENGTIVAIDEAYGEYTDHKNEVISASQFVRDYANVVVLRTFSKMYALPSARVGYMICSSEQLRSAVDTYRPMFPFSWVSLYLAQLAVKDWRYINEVRERLVRRKRLLFEEAMTLHEYLFLPSDSNTVMFKHLHMGADDLSKALACHGMLTANLNTLAGVAGEEFLRMTVRHENENTLLLQACKDVAQSKKNDLLRNVKI
ncbi:MAG: pyridoxal phosphate-dependent aminotransferase [Desulfovibrio sp.]